MALAQNQICTVAEAASSRDLGAFKEALREGCRLTLASGDRNTAEPLEVEYVHADVPAAATFDCGDGCRRSDSGFTQIRVEKAFALLRVLKPARMSPPGVDLSPLPARLFEPSCRYQMPAGIASSDQRREEEAPRDHGDCADFQDRVRSGLCQANQNAPRFDRQATLVLFERRIGSDWDDYFLTNESDRSIIAVDGLTGLGPYPLPGATRFHGDAMANTAHMVAGERIRILPVRIHETTAEGRFYLASDNALISAVEQINQLTDKQQGDVALFAFGVQFTRPCRDFLDRVFGALEIPLIAAGGNAPVAVPDPDPFLPRALEVAFAVMPTSGRNYPCPAPQRTYGLPSIDFAAPGSSLVRDRLHVSSSSASAQFAAAVLRTAVDCRRDSETARDWLVEKGEVIDLDSCGSCKPGTRCPPRTRHGKALRFPTECPR